MSFSALRWLLATVLPLVLLSCEHRDTRVSSTNGGAPSLSKSLHSAIPLPLEEVNKIFVQAHTTLNSQAALRFAKAYHPLYISSNTANPVLCSANPFDDLKLLYRENEYSLSLATYSESNLNFNVIHKGKAVGRIIFESDSEDSRFCGLDIGPPVNVLLGGPSSFAFVSLSYVSASDSLETISRLTEDGSALPQTLNKRGLLLQQLGHHREALKLLTVSINKAPRLCESYLLRGDSYWMLGKYDSARADYLIYVKVSKQTGNACLLPDYVKLLTYTK